MVYVVDDDQAVLDSMAFLLDSFGYGSELFSDPRQFLARVDGLDPGCVVTDLRMPKMTGFELITALRDRSIDWPAFLMTSDYGPDVTASAEAHGFFGFLRKPVDVSALIHALDAAFEALHEMHPDS